jgi:hypothetical protein
MRGENCCIIDCFGVLEHCLLGAKLLGLQGKKDDKGRKEERKKEKGKRKNCRLVRESYYKQTSHSRV